MQIVQAKVYKIEIRDGQLPIPSFLVELVELSELYLPVPTVFIDELDVILRWLVTSLKIPQRPARILESQ